VNPVTGSVNSGFYRAFCESNLRYRDYYYNWNAGHRYVLNLREGESYTRYFRQLDTTSQYWVGSEHIDAPDPANTFENDAPNKFGLRGNGTWSFSPALSSDGWAAAAYRHTNVTPAEAGGLRPAVAGAASELVYKVQAANAMSGQHIDAEFARTDALATAAIDISVNHGTTWTTVGTVGDALGLVAVPIDLRDEVNAAYEMLLRIRMTTDSATPDGISLTGLSIDTITQVNTKALPRLNIGRNEIYIDAGDQSDTMVLWPELRADLWSKDVYDSSNIASQPVSVPRTYTSIVYPSVFSQDAYLTYRMDAPTDITRVVYGGRLFNASSGSYIDFLHSFDNGATWTRSYRLTDVARPNDVIHYETVTAIPPGTRTVLFKYVFHTTATTASKASGLYSTRMEVDHQPATAAPAPLDVTFRWKEVKSDRTTVARSHKQLVTEFPFKYVIDVGGSDHPVMDSITLNVAAEDDGSPQGYSDGVDAGGTRYLYSRRTDGTNVAQSKPYTVSRAPSGFQNSAPPTNTTILTDGVVGAPGTGGFAYWLGQCWSGQPVDLQVDLGVPQSVGAMRAHLFGYPGWDALKGQVLDTVEVLTSLDGVAFASQGFLQTSLWRKNIPINHMLQDDEKATAWNFELLLPVPTVARYVRYHVTPKRTLCASELQVFDHVDYTPFDIRIAPPPGMAGGPGNIPPSVTLTAPAGGSQFLSPASVDLSAEAVDPDGTIQQVDFFAGSTLVGTATASPFAVTWTDAPEGSYTLTARALDNSGAMTTSLPVHVTVTDPNSLVNVPDVTGMTQATAAATLAAANLAVGQTTTATSATVAAGSVISQTPVAGVAVVRGSAVALVVSSGPPPAQLPAPWTAQDVGMVGRPGTTSYDSGSGTFTVIGAGADIWGSADAFRYVYQPFNGDGDIVARVVTVQNTNAWVKAGVMVRENLTAGAAQAMMMVTPSKGNNFQRRPAAGGATLSTAGAMVAAPYWVKLSRTGATITAYQSADGSTWAVVGSQTMTLPSSVFIGLAVSSHSASTLATATFDNVSVTNAPATVLVPDVVGFTQVNATSALAAAGLDVGSTSAVASDSVPAGNVVSQMPSAGTSVVVGSAVALTISSGPATVVVPDVSGLTQSAATTVITAASLAVGSVTTITSTSVPAGNVVSQSPAAGATVPHGSPISLVVSVGPPPTGIPTPWQTQDIGAVGVAGNASYASATSTFAVAGAGADIWGSTDALRYVYQPLSGDGQIVARVASVQNTNVWVKAGVMIRANLTPGSPQAMMMVTPGKGNNFQRRLTAGGSSVGTAGASVTAPYWVKLTRAGTLISAYQSPDGTTWSTVGTATISLPTDVLVGLAVSSHSTSALATGTFDQVMVTSTGGPAPTLPTPWVSQDVGAVGRTGSAAFDAPASTFSVAGAGADIWGSADAFRYVYQSLDGDGQIVARVVSEEYVHAWLKAGVMIRTDLTPGSAQAMMMVTPGKGNNFQRRPVAGGASVSTVGSAVTAPYWVKLTRQGSTITAYESLDGTSWTLVDTATIAMPDSVLIGLAVSSHIAGTLANVSFDQVTVGAVAPE
jgi:beta-lactam-binding protein with PASTA domain